MGETVRSSSAQPGRTSLNGMAVAINTRLTPAAEVGRKTLPTRKWDRGVLT